MAFEKPSGISDGAICKLIGTTRNTINAIRDRSHWNIAEIQPKDPVTLGLSSQRELDALVAKAAKKAGIDLTAPEDAKLGSDRDKLIEELHAEREEEKRAAEAAASGEVPEEEKPELTAETLFKKTEE